LAATLPSSYGKKKKKGAVRRDLQRGYKPEADGTGKLKKKKKPVTKQMPRGGSR